MMKLHAAYALATNLGRNPSALQVMNSSGDTTPDSLDFDFEVAGGSEPHFVRLVLSQLPEFSEVEGKWHCTCTDFRFTFWPYIDEQGFSLAQFEPYVPDGRGAPRALAEFGMCKHLLCAVDKLMEDGFLRRKE